MIKHILNYILSSRLVVKTKYIGTLIKLLPYLLNYLLYICWLQVDKVDN